MICWLKTFALELAVILTIVAFVAGVIGSLTGIAISLERVPRTIARVTKWSALSIVALCACLFAGVMTWKAHEKVCTQGFKATWHSVWVNDSR